MIKAKCPTCGAALKAPESYAGKMAKCPKCGTFSRVPEPAVPVGQAASLAAELESIADEVLAQELGAPSPSTAPQSKRTVSQKAVRKPARRSAPPRRPSAERRSYTVLAVYIFAAIALLGVLYFVGSKFLERQRMEKTRDEILAMIEQADRAFENGKFDEAATTYNRVLLAARRYKERFGDTYFDTKVAEIHRFLERDTARREVLELLQKAEALRKSKQYKAAKQAYENAVRVAELKYKKLQDDTLKDYLAQARKALASDEIRLGSEGYVQYKGNWMRPEERERRIMIDKGMVLYKGRWMTPQEKQRLVAEEQRKRLEAQRRAAQAKAKKAAAKAKVAKKPAPKRKPPAPPVDPNAKVWLLDDFENGKQLWRVQNWGAPAQLSLVKEGKSTVLKIEYTRKGSDKCAIMRRLPWHDISSRDKVVLDINNLNKGGVQVALAFFVAGSPNYFESRGKYVRRGPNKNVEFDLRAKTFKSEATGWEHRSELQRTNAVGAICLLVYPRTPGVVTIDNIRFVKK